MNGTIYTIGHSTHDAERFLALLAQHEITAVCDVRSTPHSAYNPQFNRKPLEERLNGSGIEYIFLGREMGARSDDPACYVNGKVQYNRIARTDAFQRGIERVREGAARGSRVALMCAEAEPLECHRTILVSRHLGTPVQHIHADGHLETHAQALDRLVTMLRLPDRDLFRSHEDIIEDAYRMQEARIAYTLDAAVARAAG